MNTIRHASLALFSLGAVFSSSISYALPFSVVPTTGTTLPTVLNIGDTANAYYTVTNLTGTQRNGNYVKTFPTNVTQVLPAQGELATCAQSFDLAPNGQAGDSCILQLSVAGAVNGAAAPFLFVCFPGGLTCAGTNYPLNVTVNGWSNTGLTGANIISDITALGDVMYAGGLQNGTVDYPYLAGQLWALEGSTWTQQYDDPSLTANLKVTSLIPNATNSYLYTTEEVSGYGDVDQFTPGDTGPVSVGCISTAVGMCTPPVPNATDLNDLTLGASNVLYAAGATTSEPSYGANVGDVWSWNGTAWVSTGFYQQSQLNAIWITYVAPPSSLSGLYVAAVNSSAGAVYVYGGGTTWTNTNLPTNVMSTLASINDDASGHLYALGSSSASGTSSGSILAYQGTTWTIVPAPTDSGALYVSAFSSNGTMYVGGIDTNGQGAVWYSTSPGVWVNTKLTGSTSVTSLAFSSTGILYAGGADSSPHTGSVWSLSPAP